MRVNLRVVTPDGREEALTLNVADATEAVRVALQKGYRVQAICATPKQAMVRHNAFPLVLFIQELVALLEAGLNLVEALQALVAKEARENRQEVLAALLRALQEGRALSQAMEEQPAIFSPLLVASVRSAERTGDLPPTLARYIAHELELKELRKKIVTASIYPLLLLAVGGLVALFLLGYVIPRFSVVFESSGRDLPWLSEQLMIFGRWVHTHWGLALMLVAATLGALIVTVLMPAARHWALSRVLALPGLRQRATEYRLACFYRATGMLLRSGIPLVKALYLTQDLLAADKQKVRLASTRIEAGQRFSDAFAEVGLLTPVAASLTQVGEKAGRLGEMLEHAAAFHDAELARWVEWASRIAEPLLMAVIGLVIGGIVLLMYLPIFELAGSLQ